MQNIKEFEKTFNENSVALTMGIKLRELIFDHFNKIEENIYGGKKIKLSLYSLIDTKTELCGIQQGSDDTCMLYIHHIETIEHDRLKFSGKGKHAKRIKFARENEIIAEDIYWLFSKIEENLPLSNA